MMIGSCSTSNLQQLLVPVTLNASLKQQQMGADCMFCHTPSVYQ